MKCTYCGAENVQGNRFCANCGTVLGQSPSEQGKNFAVTGSADDGVQYPEYDNTGSGETTVLNASQMPQWQAQQVQYNTRAQQYGQLPQYQMNQSQPNHYNNAGKAVKGKNAVPVKKEEKSKKGLVMVLCAVLAVVLVAVGAAGLMFAKSRGFFAKGENADTSVSQNQNDITEADDGDTTQSDPVETTDEYGVVVPDAEPTRVRFYVDSEEGLYLRKGPGEEYEAIALVPDEYVIDMRGYNEGDSEWVYVNSVAARSTGWVNKAYITMEMPQGIAAGTRFLEYYIESSYATVIAQDGVDVMYYPTDNTDVVGFVPVGEEVEVYAYVIENSNWCGIVYNDNGAEIKGFVHVSDLS